MNLEFGSENNEQMRILRKFLDKDENKNKENEDLFEEYFKANQLSNQDSQNDLEFRQINRKYHEGKFR